MSTDAVKRIREAIDVIRSIADELEMTLPELDKTTIVIAQTQENCRICLNWSFKNNWCDLFGQKPPEYVINEPRKYCKEYCEEIPF